MLQLLLAAAIAVTPMTPVTNGPVVQVEDVQVEDIAGYPPPLVEAPMSANIIQLCTGNLLEEIEQSRTGQAPMMIDEWAKELPATPKLKEQVQEYCKAYSAGAAFVVASVVMDATLNDILTRNQLLTKGHPDK